MKRSWLWHLPVGLAIIVVGVLLIIFGHLIPMPY